MVCDGPSELRGVQRRAGGIRGRGTGGGEEKQSCSERGVIVLPAEGQEGSKPFFLCRQGRICTQMYRI